MMELAQALRWLPGATLHGNPRQPIQRVHSDTRSLRAGDLFVAIQGEQFDANQFLAQAKAAGAAAALCSDAAALEAGRPAGHRGGRHAPGAGRSGHAAGARSSRCR